MRLFFKTVGRYLIKDRPFLYNMKKLNCCEGSKMFSFYIYVIPIIYSFLLPDYGTVYYICRANKNKHG